MDGRTEGFTDGRTDRRREEYKSQTIVYVDFLSKCLRLKEILKGKISIEVLN